MQDHDDREVAAATVKKKKKPKKKAVSAWLLRRRKRRKIVEYARWTVTKSPYIYYSQSRPKPSIRYNYAETKIPSSLDCSSHAIRCYQVAKVPSPSVYGYSGYGSTYDMEGYGKPIPLRSALPSDLIFYDGHMVVYIGNGLCVSHGSSSGPQIRNIYYRNDIHRYARRYFG
jgi:cell wall-associated NlpC family hydrolase